MMRLSCRVGLCGVGVFLLACLVVPGVVFGAGSVAWSVSGLSLPTEFGPGSVNRYEMLVINTGSKNSTPGVTVTDRLPAGLTMATYQSREGAEGAVWECPPELEASVVRCTLAEVLPPGGYAPPLEIEVSSPIESVVPLENRITVSEGGAALSASTSESTLVSSAVQKFAVTGFSVEAHNADGSPALQAGGHPWEVTASFGFPWAARPANPLEWNYIQVHNVKKVAVELPAGMTGNLFSTSEHCTQIQLHEGKCPTGSKVGEIALTKAVEDFAWFRTSESGDPSAVFNMVPEAGYPAQLGFATLEQPVYLDATVVHTAAGEVVRLTTVAIPPIVESGNVVLTLWGEPGAFNETGTTGAMITSPTKCSQTPLKARMEAESWGEPGEPVSAEAAIYPQITGCGGLLSGFTPAVAVSPLSGEDGTTQADAPSGFEGVGTVPQTTSFEEDAVAHVRDVSVALPPGVSINPAAAQGLLGCNERGAEGINLGSGEVGAWGEDLGNREATELGAGHAGGNGSPYDDGQWHTVPGHCPNASIIGTIEVLSPLIAARLKGHVFIAQPKCGGPGQGTCTVADAEDGVLFSGYAEASGDGVLIKERATIAVNQVTGQMTLQLRELPEFPFSEIRVKTEGGPHAPLETPQKCGVAATASVFTPWSAVSGSEVFSPPPSSYRVDGNGAGAECPAVWPFAPGFTAGTTSAVAGGFTSFTTTLTRNDREQDPTNLTIETPKGLLADIASVSLCDEKDANAGTCSENSKVGDLRVAAGSGSSPLYLPQVGRREDPVFLTGAYNGGAFGLSIVAHAEAGPFNLGDVVVRASIRVDPVTAAVTVVSDPLPLSKDGVPFRLRLVNVDVNRPGFVFNPTDCVGQSVTGSVSGSQGAVVGVSSPFGVTGCAGLGFNPAFSLSTQAKTSKLEGASLRVSVKPSAEGPQPAGKLQEANIRKVEVALPKVLPSRLTTLQKACVAATFAANPGSCPAGSIVGTAVAHTPILSGPLSGPAYLVSHGGAAFPDLEFVLQGEGVTLLLDGKTDIKAGVTYSRFETVPDAPVSSFEAVFPEGPHSILGANGSLCAGVRAVRTSKRVPVKRHGRVVRRRGRVVYRTVKSTKTITSSPKLSVPTTMTAQNNVVLSQTTQIAVTGCPTAKKATKAPTVKKTTPKKTTTQKTHGKSA